jgi:isoleucyl-tRNA synthetase
LPAHGLNGERTKDWETLLEIRALSNKAIEEKRAMNLVGSSLQSELDIYAQGGTYDVLESFADDLRFLLITSRATVHQENGSGLRIQVTPSSHIKCDRCWHYRADVGSDKDHPAICSRCVSNLFGEGEPRKFA